MSSRLIGISAIIACFAIQFVADTWAADPPTGRDLPFVIEKPDAFQTLVNPECSHCRDEAKRRGHELRNNDRVLSWIRGYSDGGAIPWRFFLNRHRVISDTYGVFIYDADAGFARGFAPSLEFSFHGWRNGVMVMKHQDGTVYSCLTGVAFEGPRRGERLKAVPTLVTDWGDWLEKYPGGVAYKMHEKYVPIDLSDISRHDSLKSRSDSDQRLADETTILGVIDGNTARAYPQEILARSGLIREDIEGRPRVVLWYAPTKTAAAYSPVASPVKDDAGTPRSVSLEIDNSSPGAPFKDRETGSHWDITGRAVDGELTGWTLAWLDSVQVKWFAWAAEYKSTSIYGDGLAKSDYQPISPEKPDFAGPQGNLDVSLRHYAILRAADQKHQTVSLVLEGDKETSEWPVSQGAQVFFAGWWGHLDQFRVGDRVWVWFDADSSKQPLSISLLADEFSEQMLYAPMKVTTVSDRHTERATAVLQFSKAGKPASRNVVVVNADVYHGAHQGTHGDIRTGESLYIQTTTDDNVRLALDAAAFDALRTKQKAELRKRWSDEGLPCTVVFRRTEDHELELMLNHECMQWSRSLEPDDQIELRSPELDQQLKVRIRQIRPWRERTQLLVNCAEQDGLLPSIGQRAFVMINPQTAARLKSHDDKYPPGLGKSGVKQERIEWLASSIYCSCNMHDSCAGHLFTLAACDGTGQTPCGLAVKTRSLFSERIEQGRTDQQIFDELLKERSEKMRQPHMSP